MRWSAAMMAVSGSLVLLLAAFAPSAAASPLRCSAGPDFDPVATSDVIIGGWIASWEPRPDIAPRSPRFTSIQLHVDVAHVWKGDLRGEPIIDGATFAYVQGQAEPLWGGGGSCGAFGEDPTGMFAVLGLRRDADGYLSTSLVRMFWLSPEPYDPAALSHPAREHFRLPALGDGSTRSDSTYGDVLLLSGIATFGCGAIALMVLHRMMTTGRE